MNFFESPLYAEGFKCLSQKNYSRAIDFFRLLTYEFPHENKVWLALGTALFEMKEFEGAEVAFCASLTLGGPAPKIWIFLGAAALERNAREEAETLFQLALMDKDFIPDHESLIEQLRISYDFAAPTIS